MAIIVGAACQPLQPADLPAGDGTIVDATTSGPAITPTALTPGATVGEPVTFDDSILVALLVPLSGRQEALGTAVRDGFIAALLEGPGSGRYTTLIIDESRVGAVEAHRQALQAGARVLVGPLLKESVQALAPLSGQTAGPMPGQMQILALNNLGDTDTDT
ncbi:MAG: penicillin-binding protein activator, partial [Gammaproteobacteria bacterium]